MKIKQFVLPLLAASLTIGRVHAQSAITWLDAPAKVADKSYGNYHPRMSLDGAGKPMVIWGKGKTVYFSRNTGTGFSMPMPLNPSSVDVFTASWAGPDMVSRGDTVYVVFKQTPEDINPIYLVRSFDGGKTFSGPYSVDKVGDAMTRFPTVAIDKSGKPVVAFMKIPNGGGGDRYVVARSTDFGTTYTREVLASGYQGEPVCDCCPAALVTEGDRMAMLYRTNQNNQRTIWAGISNDGGMGFASGFEADNTKWMISGCPSTGPDGEIIRDDLYSVFMSSGSGKALVYLSKSSLQGGSMPSVTPVTGNFTGLFTQNFPRIARDGNAAAIVWRQSSGKTQVCLSFTPSLQKGFPQTYEVVATTSHANVDVQMANGKIYVVWEDETSGAVMFREGTYSTTAIQSEQPAVRGLTVYPNPTTDMFTLDVADPATVKKIRMTDALGRQSDLSIIRNGEKLTFSTANLNAGVYTVVAEFNTGEVRSTGLVILPH